MSEQSIEQKVRADDRKWLIEQPQFRRFLFDTIEASAITRISREAQQSLLLEGKRALELEMLAWFSEEATPYDVIALAIEASKQFTRSE